MGEHQANTHLKKSTNNRGEECPCRAEHENRNRAALAQQTDRGLSAQTNCNHCSQHTKPRARKRHRYRKRVNDSPKVEQKTGSPG